MTDKTGKVRSTAFDLVQHDEFLKNLNTRSNNPNSIVLKVLDRLPMMPPHRQLHPDLETFNDDPTLRHRDFLDNMLLTDAAWMRWRAERAVENNKEVRTFGRWLADRRAEEQHAIKRLIEEDRMQSLFFHKQILSQRFAATMAAGSRLDDVDKSMRREQELRQRYDRINEHNEQLVRKMAGRVEELAAHFGWSKGDLQETLSQLSIQRQASVQFSNEKAQQILRLQSHVALAQTAYSLPPPTAAAAEMARPLAASTARLLVKKVS